MLGTRAVVILWIVFVLVGCGSGSSSGSLSNPPIGSTPALPELDNVSPRQLSIDVESGDSTVANVTFANISLTLACGGIDVSGNLTLTTNDADERNVTIPIAVTCLPSPSYEIARITLNQAARSLDSNLNSDPNIGIVAGRDILVRAFVTGDGGIPDAHVVVATGSNEQSFSMQLPPTVDTRPADESILSASHFIVVPGSALSVGATLRVEVNPGSFNITFVPVQFDGQTASIDGEQYLRQTHPQLPIGGYDIEVRSPYQFSGTYDLDVLLDEIADLRDPHATAAITWSAGGLTLGWQPQRGDSLILRDADGAVRAMDRSGRLVVDQVFAGSILAIIQPGLGLQRAHLASAGRDPVWLLER